MKTKNNGNLIFVFILIMMVIIGIYTIRQENRINNDKLQCESKGGTYYGGIMKGGCNLNTDCEQRGNMFCKCVTGCYNR